MSRPTLLVILAFLWFSSGKLFSQANILDSLTLVDLYNNTSGSTWTVKINWLSSKPISTWSGVTTDQNGRVISLSLINNNLKGPLPTSIGNLDGLKFDLHLDNNLLTGNLPTTIGKLKYLSQCILVGNKFSGNIPAEIGDMISLTYLDLGYNNFTGTIPSTIGNLANLTKLFLISNQLSGSLPNNLGNLKNLVNFYCDYNQLSGSLPDSIGNLSSLTSLSVSNNKFTGKIPLSFSNLINLRLLNLSVNQFSDLFPVQILVMDKLIQLNFSYNKFSGPLPTSINLLMNLQSFNIEGNQFSGTVPIAFTGLTHLQTLNLRNNSFTFEGMENLAGIAMYANQARIPLMIENGKLLFPTGGTPSNNFYNWYLNGKVIAQFNADSTFTPVSNGKYWATAINSVATQLTLYSDTVMINTLPIKVQVNATSNLEKTFITVKYGDQTTFPQRVTLEYSKDGRNFTPLSSKNIYLSMDTFTIIRQSLNNDFFIRIFTKGVNGENCFSNILIIDKEQPFEELLTVNPNPALGGFVEVKFKDISQVMIFDGIGRIIKNIRNSAPTNFLKVTLPKNGERVFYLTIKDIAGKSYFKKIITE